MGIHNLFSFSFVFSQLTEGKQFFCKKTGFEPGPMLFEATAVPQPLHHYSSDGPARLSLCHWRALHKGK